LQSDGKKLAIIMTCKVSVWDLKP